MACDVQSFELAIIYDISGVESLTIIASADGVCYPQLARRKKN